MFEVGEECQRRALRYLVEVADMSYGDIVKLAQEANSNSRITKRKLRYLAEKMKADGEPLKTKQPERLKTANEARKRVVENSTTPVENSEPKIERVTVVVRKRTTHVENTEPKCSVRNYTETVENSDPENEWDKIVPHLWETLSPKQPAPAKPRHDAGHGCTFQKRIAPLPPLCRGG